MHTVGVAASSHVIQGSAEAEMREVGRTPSLRLSRVALPPRRPARPSTKRLTGLCAQPGMERETAGSCPSPRAVLGACRRVRAAPTEKPAAARCQLQRQACLPRVALGLVGDRQLFCYKVLQRRGIEDLPARGGCLGGRAGELPPLAFAGDRVARERLKCFFSREFSSWRSG